MDNLKAMSGEGLMNLQTPKLNIIGFDVWKFIFEWTKTYFKIVKLGALKPMFSRISCKKGIHSFWKSKWNVIWIIDLSNEVYNSGA